MIYLYTCISHFIKCILSSIIGTLAVKFWLYRLDCTFEQSRLKGHKNQLGSLYNLCKSLLKCIVLSIKPNIYNFSENIVLKIFSINTL